MLEKHSLNEQKKYFNELSKHKHKCKCGHSVIITNNRDKVLCTWCHHYVYKSKRDEFLDSIKGMI